MLKFQDNNTTVIATFEDFILTTYVIIDELYHQFAPPEVTSRRHILDAKRLKIIDLWKLLLLLKEIPHSPPCNFPLFMLQSYDVKMTIYTREKPANKLYRIGETNKWQ